MSLESALAAIGLTMTDAKVLAGSAAVVLFMIAVALLLGFRKSARIEAGDLAGRLAQLEPGARIAQLMVSQNGREAAALLDGGKVLLVRAMGDGLALRAYDPKALKVSWRNGAAFVAVGDLGFPPLTLRFAGAEPPAWFKRLAPGG